MGLPRCAVLCLALTPCLAALAPAAGDAAHKQEPKTVRLLTIGNSFAQNALRFLPDIVKASGNELIVGRANLGGCTFERHWNHAAKYLADPSDKAGKPYGGKSLVEMLQSRKWDAVTVQQVSWQSHDTRTYEPYASNVVGLVRKHAPQARLLMHQTWAYRVDDPRFVPANAGKQPHTHKVMYEQVRSAYHAMARKLDTGILPSGDAMYLADTDPTWGYQPDPAFGPKTAKHPALPDQSHSLHGGYSWRKQKDGSWRLGMDGHHANRNGEYLIGCVWYEVLFGRDVTNNPYVPKGLDAAYAAFLRKTAHQAVANLRAEKQPAKPTVEILCDKRYRIAAPEDVGKELGRYHIRGVRREGEETIRITEELTLVRRGKKGGYASTVVYTAAPAVAPVQADATTLLEGKLCMTGKVAFQKTTWSHSCLGLLDPRTGAKISPPREYVKQALPKPAGLLVFQSALPVLGPRFLARPGEAKVVWVEFPDDIAAPELITLKPGHRLVRTKPDADGRYFIRVYGPHSDKPRADAQFDKNDKLISVPAYGRWTLTEAPPARPAKPQ